MPQEKKGIEVLEDNFAQENELTWHDDQIVDCFPVFLSFFLFFLFFFFLFFSSKKKKKKKNNFFFIIKKKKNKKKK